MWWLTHAFATWDTAGRGAVELWVWGQSSFRNNLWHQNPKWLHAPFYYPPPFFGGSAHCIAQSVEIQGWHWEVSSFLVSFTSQRLNDKCLYSLHHILYCCLPFPIYIFTQTINILLLMVAKFHSVSSCWPTLYILRLLVQLIQAFAAWPGWGPVQLG